MRRVVAAFLLMALLAAEDKEKPKPKFPVGKETTYITEPLDKDGYLDYQAALNDQLAKGITPEKNANVLLWKKALGPTPEGGTGMPAEYFKRLGIDEPPKDGDYFLSLSKYMREHLKLKPEEFEAIFDQELWATKRPWTAKDYPRIAGWLKANEKPLAVVIEASKRPEYFNPLISRPKEGEPTSLIGALFPNVQTCREVASALTGRAMLRVADGKFDDAWQDLLACHRLARLIGRGATLIEALTGIAIDQIASQTDLAYLAYANLTAKQIQNRLKDLQGLPPMPPMADKIDLGERFSYLESLQLIRRGMLETEADGKTRKPTVEELKALDMIDWEPALRNINRWCDRLAAALRLKDEAERKKALLKIEDDLHTLDKETGKAGKLIHQEKTPPEKTVGKVISDVMIVLQMSCALKVHNAYERCEQTQRNLHLAFALAACRRDNGHYPAKLEDLAPKYLATVPDDLFSGKALHYRLTDKGYLLYSVGVNGKDDGGQGYDDEPSGDDLPVRMPLPELKRKK